MLALVLEACFGLTSGYLKDIRVLMAINDAGLVERVINSAARQFDNLLIFAAIFVASAALVDRKKLSSPSRANVAAVLSSDAGWVAAFTATAILYESQNTGSNEFIYLWPLWLRVLLNGLTQGRRRSYVLGALVAAAALPSITAVAQRAARASITSLAAVNLPTPHLDGFGAARVSPADLERGRFFLKHYSEFAAAYRDMAERGLTQTVNLFAQSDYQIFYLLSVDEAVAAIEAFEQSHGIVLRSIFTLDFVDPLSHLLDVRPPRFVSLALDPRRTFPPVDRRAMREMAAIDAIAIPLCPDNADRVVIAAAYRPALEGRRPVRISPCWELRIRPDLLPPGP